MQVDAEITTYELPADPVAEARRNLCARCLVPLPNHRPDCVVYLRWIEPQAADAIAAGLRGLAQPRTPKRTFTFGNRQMRRNQARQIRQFQKRAKRQRTWQPQTEYREGEGV